MFKKFAAVGTFVAAVGLAAMAVPALAQQPAAGDGDGPVTCSYHESASMAHEEMEQWMGADHDQIHAEMYAEMRDHMGDLESTRGYGSMMGHGSMMGLQAPSE